MSAALIEDIGIGKGHDPRTFALVAYGGGGSLIASAIASRLEIGKVIVPPSPGTFSAWGMLTLDIVHDFSRTWITSLGQLRGPELAEAFAELNAQGLERLEAERVEPERRQLHMFVDMRYDGQEHTIAVPIGAQFLRSAGRRRAADGIRRTPCVELRLLDGRDGRARRSAGQGGRRAGHAAAEAPRARGERRRADSERPAHCRRTARAAVSSSGRSTRAMHCRPATSCAGRRSWRSCRRRPSSPPTSSCPLTTSEI